MRSLYRRGVAIRVPWLRRSTLHHCPGACIPTKLVIANQCAHWFGNPFSPQRNLASWHYFWQIRSTFPYSPKVLLSVMPCRKEYGLPRRSAPRNDMQKLAACAHGKDVMPGKFVTPHEFALSTAVLLCPAARSTDCHVAPLLAMTCRRKTVSAVART